MAVPTTRTTGGRHRVHLLRSALVLSLGLAMGLASVQGDAPAQAANLANFNPGFIVSDSVFYDSGSMTAAQVQTFLEQKNAGCSPGGDGTPCLKDYRETTATRAASSKCAGTYQGAGSERASDIISKVGIACGINPRVLVVMLQKEQGLVTGSGYSLSASRYQKAMGYGCPDTAACNTLYYGFFNQVYSAAAQFRNYANNPASYSHHAGMVNNVRFNPNTACGSSGVFIQNQATASLYNYTPYQPNAAALNAGYGTGDSCSAYGNRNFWNYFSDWFGSPTGVPPLGHVDTLTTNADGLAVKGWAYDPDTNASIRIRVDVDVRGAGSTYLASESRPDVGAAFGRGDNHGFSVNVPVVAGAHSMCVWALNSDSASADTLAYCADIVIPKQTIGHVDSATTTATSITLTGWAFDAGWPDPIQVHMYVDGASQAFTANTPRPDVGTLYGVGPNHGFTVTMPATIGSHNACIYAIGVASGTAPMIGCLAVVNVNSDPTTWLDAMAGNGASITANGWAFDKDTTGPIQVSMSVDGISQAFSANAARPDVGAAFGVGADHGYAVTMPAAPGTHNVCLYAINSPAGNNPTIGCRTVVNVNSDPTTWLDAVTGNASSITANGWAFDKDTTGPIQVHMSVDGVSQAFTANGPRPDVGTYYGVGPDHGYAVTMPAAPGTHTVCLYAINSPTGNNPTIGCRSITTVNSDPTTWIDSVTGNASSITAKGWAFDKDTTGPIQVHMYVDGASQAFTANGSRPDVGTYYGVGPDHGYVVTMPAAPGTHNVCFYAINSPTGNNPMFGCRTATVG